MPETIRLRFRCPYPTTDDRGRPEFGIAGRCDHVEEWDADAIVQELPDETGTKLIRSLLVRNAAGNCPACGQTGELVKQPPGKDKTATVRLS